jgi:hypothetical protein
MRKRDVLQLPVATGWGVMIIGRPFMMNNGAPSGFQPNYRLAITIKGSGF